MGRLTARTKSEVAAMIHSMEGPLYIVDEARVFAHDFIAACASRTRYCERAMALNRSAAPVALAGMTKRKTAFGPTKRRIRQPQAIRSILAQLRATHRLRSFLSRSGILS